MTAPNVGSLQINVTIPSTALTHDLHITYTPRKQRSTHTQSPSTSPPLTPINLAPVFQSLSLDDVNRGPVSQAMPDGLDVSSPPHPNDSFTSTSSLTPNSTMPPSYFGPTAPLVNPAHRRILEEGQENYAVPFSTQQAFPPLVYPGTRRQKAWYVIGKGLDFGIFFDYWFVNVITNFYCLLSDYFRYNIQPLVEPFKGKGALFRKCATERDALDLFDSWERMNKTGIIVRKM